MGVVEAAADLKAEVTEVVEAVEEKVADAVAEVKEEIAEAAEKMEAAVADAVTEAKEEGWLLLVVAGIGLETRDLHLAQFAQVVGVGRFGVSQSNARRVLT